MSIDNFIDKKLFEDKLNGSRDLELYSILMDLFKMGYEHNYITKFFNTLSYMQDNPPEIASLIKGKDIKKIFITRMFASGAYLEVKLSDDKRYRITYLYNNPEFKEFAVVYFRKAKKLDRRIIKTLITKFMEDYDCIISDSIQVQIGWSETSHTISEILND